MIVRLMDARFVGVGTIPKRGAASTVGDYMYVNFVSVNIQCMHVTAAARARTPLGVPQRVEEEEAPDGAKRWILPQIRPRQEGDRRHNEGHTSKGDYERALPVQWAQRKSSVTSVLQELCQGGGI